MGYLGEEQENVAEAAKHYRCAVELDPLYLNAWSLEGLDSKLNFSGSERDELLLKLLALDPGQKHASSDLAKVSDLPRLWRALKESQEIVAALPAPQKLYRLQASADRLAQMKAEAQSAGLRRTHSDFATVLLGHDFVERLQEYLVVLNQPEQEN